MSRCHYLGGCHAFEHALKTAILDPALLHVLEHFLHFLVVSELVAKTLEFVVDGGQQWPTALINFIRRFGLIKAGRQLCGCREKQLRTRRLRRWPVEQFWVSWQSNRCEKNVEDCIVAHTWLSIERQQRKV